MCSLVEQAEVTVRVRAQVRTAATGVKPVGASRGLRVGGCIEAGSAKGRRGSMRSLCYYGTEVAALWTMEWRQALLTQAPPTPPYLASWQSGW